MAGKTYAAFCTHVLYWMHVAHTAEQTVRQETHQKGRYVPLHFGGGVGGWGSEADGEMGRGGSALACVLIRAEASERSQHGQKERVHDTMAFPILLLQKKNNNNTI